jgi:hypothetical protein
MEEVEKCLFCKNSDGSDKDLYTTRKSALQDASIIKLKKGIEIYIYPCPKRVGWHLTSKYTKYSEIHNKNYYVFIDWYGLTYDDINTIIDEIKKDGNIIGIKLYGNYDNIDKDVINKNGIEIINVDFFIDQLDTILVNMIIDAIHSAIIDESINSISLVSSNNTFYILANKLKKMGFFVLGFGLIQNEDNNVFDKYINIKELSFDVKTMSDNMVLYLEMIKFGLEHSITNDYGWIKYNDFTFTVREKYSSDADRICGLGTLRKIINSHKDEFLIKDSNDILYLKLKKLTIDYGRIYKCSDSFGIIQNKKGQFYFAGNAFLSGKISPKLIDKNVKFKIFKYPDSDGMRGRAGEIEITD